MAGMQTGLCFGATLPLSLCMAADQGHVVVVMDGGRDASVVLFFVFWFLSALQMLERLSEVRCLPGCFFVFLALLLLFCICVFCWHDYCWQTDIAFGGRDFAQKSAILSILSSSRGPIGFI